MTTTDSASKMTDAPEIIRIKQEQNGEDGPDEYFENCPLYFQQPSIFELTKRETMKKMGKVTKEAVIQKVLQKVIFIRDSDIAMPKYDPTAEDPSVLPDLSKKEGDDDTPICSSNLPYCRFGCVCQSVNCPDMYDEYYEKHCRDTGDPACMYGCICENPGPHLNGDGNSKWITCRPYKYKKQRAKDDEDCGFVPVHLREQMREGRPKRKAQAPTRYRPDFSISEKELRAYENGSSNSSSNGFSSKRTSRPRRRLCEQEDDDDGSDDSDERIISDKKRSVSRRDASDCPSPPKKGRPTKQQAARNLREPSKRERKPRNLDLPEPKPKRPYRKSGGGLNGISSKSTPSTNSESIDDIVENGTDTSAALGLSLRVIDIQPASRTCQGMFAVLRKSTCQIMTFVSWDEGANARPYIQDLKYKFTSSRANQATWVDGTDLLILPNVKAEDTMWLFYSIKRNFRNWDTIMCKELHSVIKSQLLHEVIERHRHPAIQNGVSRVVEISHLNSNRRTEPSSYRCGPIYLYFGKKGDLYWFGVPPKVYIQKNINNPEVNPNTLIKKRQHIQRRYLRNINSPNMPLLKLKPKSQTILIAPKAQTNGPFVLNRTIIKPSTPTTKVQSILPKNLINQHQPQPPVSEKVSEVDKPVEIEEMDTTSEQNVPCEESEITVEETAVSSEHAESAISAEHDFEAIVTVEQESMLESVEESIDNVEEVTEEQELTRSGHDVLSSELQDCSVLEISVQEKLEGNFGTVYGGSCGQELTTPEVFPPSPEITVLPVSSECYELLD